MVFRTLKNTSLNNFRSCYRGVARGGGAFGRSVNPIQTRGADHAPHTTANPPGFKKYLHLCTILC